MQGNFHAHTGHRLEITPEGWRIDGVPVIAKYFSVVLNLYKKKVDYVEQLMKRGYTQAAATEAWKITVDGGANLLLNLIQTDTITRSDSEGN